MCCHKSLLEELSASCVTAPEKNFRKLVPSFLQTSAHAIFFFASSALCCFAIINLSHKYNSMLNPMSSPTESLNLEVVLGTTELVPYIIYLCKKEGGGSTHKTKFYGYIILCIPIS